jgi:hypothetical protein
MKRQSLKTFVMLSLLLLVTAVSIAAQTSRKTVTIPFSFNVEEKTLPAGEYTIEPYRTSYNNLWLLKSQDGDSKILFTTNSVGSVETQRKDMLVFRRYGSQHFLAQIWTAGSSSGRELVVRRPKAELAKNTVERETLVLPIGSLNQR